MRYEKFKLKCGHEGNIVWRSNGTIAVRGTRQKCGVCSAKTDKGWRFTVHIIRLET